MDYEPCKYCGGQGMTYDSNDEGRTLIQIICPSCQGVGIFEHDEISCNALKEYKESSLKKTPKLMIEIAKKHGTTTRKMKKHWICIKNS